MFHFTYANNAFAPHGCDRPLRSYARTTSRRVTKRYRVKPEKPASLVRVRNGRARVG